MLRIHQAFTRQPVLNVAKLVEQTQLSQPTVDAAMRRLEAMRVISEWTGRQRGRMFRDDVGRYFCTCTYARKWFYLPRSKAHSLH